MVLSDDNEMNIKSNILLINKNYILMEKHVYDVTSFIVKELIRKFS